MPNERLMASSTHPPKVHKTLIDSWFRRDETNGILSFHLLLFFVTTPSSL